MKKYIFSLMLSCGLLNAGLVNGIAIIVNNQPITLYDIDNEMQANQVSKKIAVKNLVDKKIYDQQIEQNNISVDIFDVDNYIDRLAKQNKMNSLDFKSLIRQQQDYEKFKKQVEEQIKHQKLIEKIAQGKLKIATDEDLQIYYDNNKDKFKIADTLDVVAYISKDKDLLNQLKLNPMLNNENITSQEMSLKQRELTSQVRYVLNNTKSNEFSAIFAQNKNYNMFFVKDKKDVKTIPFENVKENIFQTVMKNREDSFLDEFFETLKLTAEIKVLR